MTGRACGLRSGPPSAFASAQESDDFKFGSDGFELLLNLATNYWIEVQTNGDVEARKSFGPSYASRDKTTLSKAGKKRRTFSYKEDSLFMEKHLKIGVAENTADTLRIHFEWLPEEKVIVIGHCGGHLDF